jgi:cysteine desulfurase/selenocysteine lyase
MISAVGFDGTTYQGPPYRFEAGTPAIAEATGLATAIHCLEALGLERIARYEDELLAYATAATSGVEGLRLVGTARARAGVLSFVLDDVHPHDIATILDREGIAIRAGHHCCQPLMTRLGLAAPARASVAPYTTREEIDALVAGLQAVRRVFG